MTYIDDCRAPDLGDLNSSAAMEYLGNRLIGRGPSDRTACSFVTLYVMSVDKAIREYVAGREILIECTTSANQPGLMIEGLGRFETCINSVKRAFRLVDRLAAQAQGPAIERVTRRALKPHDKVVITPIRNCMEHMDKIVQQGELAEDESQTLFVTRDGCALEISEYRLTFTDLAAMLRMLRSLASELSTYIESHPPADT